MVVMVRDVTVTLVKFHAESKLCTEIFCNFIRLCKCQVIAAASLAV
jgi:hypothetical protein